MRMPTISVCIWAYNGDILVQFNSADSAALYIMQEPVATSQPSIFLSDDDLMLSLAWYQPHSRVKCLCISDTPGIQRYAIHFLALVVRLNGRMDSLIVAAFRSGVSGGNWDLHIKKSV